MSNQNLSEAAGNSKAAPEEFYRPLSLEQKREIHKALVRFGSKGQDHAPRLLALHLLHYYHDPITGKLCPGQETLGEDFGISARAIRDSITFLRKHGILETTLAPTPARGFNMYRFNMPHQWITQPTSASGDEDVLRPEAQLPRGYVPEVTLAEAWLPVSCGPGADLLEAELPASVKSIIEKKDNLLDSSSNPGNVRRAALRAAQGTDCSEKEGTGLRAKESLAGQKEGKRLRSGSAGLSPAVIVDDVNFSTNPALLSELQIKSQIAEALSTRKYRYCKQLAEALDLPDSERLDEPDAWYEAFKRWDATVVIHKMQSIMEQQAGKTGESAADAAPEEAPTVEAPAEETSAPIALTDAQLMIGAEAIKNLVKDKGMLSHPLVAIDAMSWKPTDVVQMIGMFNGHYKMGLPVATDENADLFRPAIRQMQEVLTGTREAPKAGRTTKPVRREVKTAKTDRPADPHHTASKSTEPERADTNEVYNSMLTGHEDMAASGADS